MVKSVWEIKSKWLRAPVALVLTPVLAVALVVIFGAETIQSVRDGLLAVVEDKRLKLSVLGWWRAITFREVRDA